MQNKAPARLSAVTVANSSDALIERSRRWFMACSGLMMLGLGWLLMLSLSPPVLANTITLSGPGGDFANGSLSGWKERSFAGNTDYELVDEQGVRVLRGHANGKASILYTEQGVDLTSTPLIEWSWKVDRTYAGINEQSRQGDDFPARLYVVVKTGLLPWQTLAINYIWSADADLGDSWANPFTSKAHMVVVQSGDQHVGSWVQQQRDVRQDFKTFFDTDITQLNGYAVMVDGDNADKEGIAWFGQIRFKAK